MTLRRITREGALIILQRLLLAERATKDVAHLVMSQAMLQIMSDRACVTPGRLGSRSVGLKLLTHGRRRELAPEINDTALYCFIVTQYGTYTRLLVLYVSLVFVQPIYHARSDKFEVSSNLL